MDRAVDTVHKRDAVPQPPGVLDPDGDIQQTVAIEVPEFIDRVQFGRQDESLPSTNGGWRNEAK